MIVLAGVDESTSKVTIKKARAYKRKDELVQKKIPPRATYKQNKYKIVAKQK